MQKTEIHASDVEEAIKKAKDIFAKRPDIDFVIVYGEATAGGAALIDARGGLVLHRSGYGRYMGTLSEEEAMQSILDNLEES